MTARPEDPCLHRLAKRLVWDRPPEDAVRDTDFLLVRVMSLGTVEDVVAARTLFAQDDFRRALDAAPPGVFDPRSWAYWHLVLHGGEAPPLPTRNLLEERR